MHVELPGPQGSETATVLAPVGPPGGGSQTKASQQIQKTTGGLCALSGKQEGREQSGTSKRSPRHLADLIKTLGSSLCRILHGPQRTAGTQGPLDTCPGMLSCFALDHTLLAHRLVLGRCLGPLMSSNRVPLLGPRSPEKGRGDRVGDCTEHLSLVAPQGSGGWGTDEGGWA